MLIECKETNICIKSNNPSFKYKFGKAGDPVEVDDKHIEKILANPSFIKSDKKIKSLETPVKKETKEKSFIEELIEINGIGEKIAKDILLVFPTKGKLLETLEKEENLPFNDDIEEKLREVFIH